MKLKITGGKTLSGLIKISGSKNSAVAVLPASLLCMTNAKILKVPKIRDIEYLTKNIKSIKLYILLWEKDEFNNMT